MSFEVSFDKDGGDSAFDRFGEGVQKRLSQAIRKCALDIQTDAMRAAPVSTGLLRASIAVTMLSALEATIGSSLVYAALVEFGSSPHTSSDGSDDFVASITVWAKRKGIPDNQIYALIRYIRMHGTKPHPFLIPAYQTHVAKLKEALGEVIAA